MQIMEWETFLKEGLPSLNGFSAMTVGVFDGVHCGHRALIEKIICHEKSYQPVIVTFRQNLKRSGNPGGPYKKNSAYPGDISSFSQRITAFETMGVAVTIVADLTESFRVMSGAEFLRVLRERGGMGFLAVGSNFRCGFNQDTAAADIREINAREDIPTDIVEVLTEDGAPISSSRIRTAIASGNLDEATSMLGHPFVLDLRDAEYLSTAGLKDPVLSLKPCPGGIVLGTGGLGSVLPPSGVYQVLLYQKGEETGIAARIVLDKKNIFVPDLPPCANWEFIEFAGGPKKINNPVASPDVD